MYRQFLGDFFLVTLPGDQGEYRILIDCGVIVGQPGGPGRLVELVGKLQKEAGGKLDLVVATHRHADHISGFSPGQAGDIFKNQFEVAETWVSWVENPEDKIGKELLDTHDKAEGTLHAASQAMKLHGMGASKVAGEEIEGLLTFRGEFAAKGSTSTKSAIDRVKELGPGPLRYCRPDDSPRPLGKTGAKAFVFGPPRDLKALGKMNPSKTDPETYGITAMRALAKDFAAAFGDGGEGADDAPFDANWTIDLDSVDVPEIVKSRYLSEAERWRRIDGDWFSDASALALAFDQAVNNTSLVLAIELAGGDVLLFAADAQVGNWLSWQALSWDIPGGGKVTAPDLLKRAIFYKVGHHASHNATLAQKGLEQMPNLMFAMISVDHKVAVSKKWKEMPFDELLKALKRVTQGRTVRADEPLPPEVDGHVTKPTKPGCEEDYYELTLR